MKIGIFTLAITLLSFIKVGAQPLQGSPLPDTITYLKQSQEIYTYNPNNSIQSIRRGFYWAPENDYSRSLYTDTYSYYPDGKLYQISNIWRTNTYFYNINCQDSLWVNPNQAYNTWYGDKIFSFEYNKDKKLIKKIETNSNSLATYPVNVAIWDFDSLGTLKSYQFESYSNDDGTLISKNKEAYEYENGLKRFKTNLYWDASKNEWTPSALKFEYIYLDGDTLVDKVQFYQFNNDQYVKINARIEYFYTDTSYTEVFRQNDAFFDRSVTVYKNNKDQEILNEEVIYCSNLSIYKPQTRKVTSYLPSGSLDKIVTYESSNDCLVKDTLFNEVAKTLYGYKKVISSISENNEIKDNLSIFPNPASDVINIVTIDASILATRLFDQTGRLLRSTFPNEHQTTMFRNDLPSGTYFIQVTTTNGVVTKPIILL